MNKRIFEASKLVCPKKDHFGTIWAQNRGLPVVEWTPFGNSKVPRVSSRGYGDDMIPFESNPSAPKNWANLVDLGAQAALGIERLL